MDVARRSVLAGLLTLQACSPGKLVRQKITLHIASDGYDLVFKPDHLACPANSDVTLFFRHAGEIIHDPHDWVLLKQGTEKAFLDAADKSSEGGIVPENSAFVIAHTPLCPMGKTVSVTFGAPPPGVYPYVCSIPGHGESMHGTLKVAA